MWAESYNCVGEGGGAVAVDVAQHRARRVSRQHLGRQAAPGVEHAARAAVIGRVREPQRAALRLRTLLPVALEPDVDGDYVLGVADEQRLFGPDYGYRVEIEPVRNQVQFCITTDYRESSEKRDTL